MVSHHKAFPVRDLVRKDDVAFTECFLVQIGLIQQGAVDVDISVGIDIHEDPTLSQNCHDILKAGHVVTVEPGIYLPGVGGVRIENTCLVKENGCTPLTTADKQLIIL